MVGLSAAMGSDCCHTGRRRRRRCLLPAVTGEASTTRCRVAPAQTKPRRCLLPAVTGEVSLARCRVAPTHSIHLEEKSSRALPRELLHFFMAPCLVLILTFSMQTRSTMMPLLCYLFDVPRPLLYPRVCTRGVVSQVGFVPDIPVLSTLAVA